MASRKIQPAQIVKNSNKKVVIAASSNNTSTSPMTRSKARVFATSTSLEVASGANPTMVLHDKHRRGKDSRKFPSDPKNSTSASLSPRPSHSIYDVDSSTGSQSGSSPSSPKYSGSSSYSESSYSIAMQVMTNGTSTIEEQLATMARAIEKLTKTVEEKDLQIASLMNKLEAHNVGETSQGNSHPPGFTPQVVPTVGENGQENCSSIMTASTGGAGPTILATSFLLLAEEVVAYSKGQKIKVKPYSGMRSIDFGKGIGKKDVYLLNLPEVRSAHEVLGVPTVSARFGTAPFYWNWAMVAMTNLFPVEFLRDRSKVQKLVQLFDPVVRVVDEIAGERVSMRVDLECSGGRNTLALFSHRRLSVSVGIAIAAFAIAILEGSTQPGVWFPEEPEGIAIEARDALLKRATEGTINFIMNKPPWMVETDPKELGLGIYL